MKKIFLFAFLLIFNSLVYSQDIPVPDIIKTTSDIPEEFKNLRWNKWDTDNFIILSINENQGVDLKNNLESVKSQIFSNWAIGDFDFDFDCKVVCVSNKELLYKLFKLNSFHYEVRKNDAGKIDSAVVWLCLDESDLKFALSNICYEAYSEKFNIDIPFYLKNGMSFLNQNVEIVEDKLKNSNEDPIPYDSLHNLTSFDENLKNEQINNCAIICLMLRKEYGQDNYLKFLKSQKLNAFGIKDEVKLNEIYNRYYTNLIKDLKNEKVPNSYIKIRRF